MFEFMYIQSISTYSSITTAIEIAEEFLAVSGLMSSQTIDIIERLITVIEITFIFAVIMDQIMTFNIALIPKSLATFEEITDIFISSAIIRSIDLFMCYLM